MAQEQARGAAKSTTSAIGPQKELFEAFEQINRDWLDRLKMETDLAADFFSKLASARTLPDAALAYQECASRRMQILAGDAQRLLAAGEKLLPGRYAVACRAQPLS